MRGEDREQVGVALVQQFDSVRESTVTPLLINLQEPDDGSQQDDRAFDEKIALLGDPCLVEIEHDRISRFVGVRDVGHEPGVDRVATVAAARVVEVDDIEFRGNLIAVQVCAQVVVGDDGQIVELEVVDVHRVTFLDHLLDVVVHHRVALARAGRAQYDAGPERVDDIDPAGVPPLPVVEQRGKIDRVFVPDVTDLLHETFVLVVERVIRHPAREQPSEPDARREQTDITRAEGYRIEEARGGGPEMQVQQDVTPEKEHGPGNGTQHDALYGYPFAAHAARAQAGKSEQHEAEQLGIKRGVKEPRSALETGQHPVDDAGRSSELFQPAVTEPIDVHDEQQDADRPHKLHDLGKAPKIVFVLHDGKGLGGKYKYSDQWRNVLMEMSPTGTLRPQPSRVKNIQKIANKLKNYYISFIKL